MPAPNSQRALAAQTGYSLATVSMALRDLPRVAAKTRRIIQEAARDTGYRANARVAGAMRQIRRPSSARSRDTAAWIFAPYAADQTPRHDYLRTMREAASLRAERLGWQIEAVNLRDPQWTAASLGRILFHRGIHSAVLPPFQAAVDNLGIDFSRMAAVAIGYSLPAPPLSRVARSSIDSMELLFQELLRRGYRRPAFIQLWGEHLKTHRLPWAGFHVAQQVLPPAHRLPVLTIRSPDAVAGWVRRHRPDVVIGDSVSILGAIRRAGIRVPRDLGFALNTRTREDRGIAGLDPNYALLAESATDLVIQMAQQHEFGIPRVPRVLLVGSTWRNGATLRPPARSGKA